MRRRTVFRLAAAAAIASSILCIGTAFGADAIRIGAVAPKTGPLAAGAAITHWPNVQLWAHQVNERGGLQDEGRLQAQGRDHRV